MDQSLIEKYKNEMLKMYRSQRSIPAMAQTESVMPQSPPPATPTPPIPPATQRPPTAPTPPAPDMPPPQRPAPNMPDGRGRLVAIVTTLRNLYPVEGAKVTVFTGDYGNPQVIDTALTDQSGRTKEFVLDTPLKQLSMESGSVRLPYAVYNMLVEAEGYVDNIHLNIPVFSSVASLQNSNMMLIETAGVNKGPQIFDELQQFDL